MSAKDPYGNALDEWKEARSVLARFDNNLHDLRKYGFSFITALLAANGLISVGGDSEVSAEVKAGILIAIMGLIVALKLLDSHYQCFESAASLRCRLLEDRLNLELTGDVAFFYDLQHWWTYVLGLYLGFVGLTLLLGIAILWNYQVLLILIGVAAAISAILIILIDRGKGNCGDLQDWTVDLKIVNKGIPVRITFTNLNSSEKKEPGTFTLWWTVKPLQVNSPMEKLKVPSITVTELRYFQNYVWLWETNDVNLGLYQFEMYFQRGKIEEIENARKDDKITETELQQEFLSSMIRNKKTPCTWIVQVVPPQKQEKADDS